MCNDRFPQWSRLFRRTIETPLQNKIMRVIKKNHVTKYLEMLAEIAEVNDDYKKFYERFVKCMKLGIHENSVDNAETAELLRFNTSKPGDEQISLKEYVDRMKEGLDLGDEELEPLTKLMKEVLGDKVEEAIVDDRTVDSLRVLTTSGHGLSANMEHIMKAQAPRDDSMHLASGSGQQVEGGEWETFVGRRRKKGDQEGRKKGKEREAEEGGSEQVKKDVTGWTEVTRKKRKKMVQIFVKMNESKVIPMEVSLEDDKVEDVMRQIQKDEDAYVTLHGRVLKGSDKLKSCGVTDGCTIQVTNRLRGGGKHKVKKSKESAKTERMEHRVDQEVKGDKTPVMRECDKDAYVQMIEQEEAYRKIVDEMWGGNDFEVEWLVQEYMRMNRETLGWTQETGRDDGMCNQMGG